MDVSGFVQRAENIFYSFPLTYQLSGSWNPWVNVFKMRCELRWKLISSFHPWQHLALLMPRVSVLALSSLCSRAPESPARCWLSTTVPLLALGLVLCISCPSTELCSSPGDQTAFSEKWYWRPQAGRRWLISTGSQSFLGVFTVNAAKLGSVSQSLQMQMKV